MLLRNKKGDKVFAFWWIFIWIVVAGAIILSVNVFYSAPVDVRGAEAEMLNKKILDCVIENGFLIEGFDENFNVFEKCKISEKVFGEGGFYFRISVFDEKNMKIYSDIFKGVVFETECKLTEDKNLETKYFPECSKVSRDVVNVKDGKFNKIRVEVLTASNQIGGRL